MESQVSGGRCEPADIVVSVEEAKTSDPACRSSTSPIGNPVLRAATRLELLRPRTNLITQCVHTPAGPH